MKLDTNIQVQGIAEKQDKKGYFIYE